MAQCTNDVRLTICDPPQDFQHNGDNTGTRAMTRHAKRDI